MAVLTQPIVDDLVAQYEPSGKDQYIKDDLIKGLELKLARNTGRPTWTFYGRIRLSKNQRVTLGRHPQQQLDDARIQATQMVGHFARGIDPIEQRRSKKQDQLDDADIQKRRRTTLQEMLDYHIKMKEVKTAYDYRNTFKNCFGRWLDKPIQDIKEINVEEAYYDLRHKGKLHQTEKAFTILNAVMNTAMNRAIASRSSNSKSPRYLDHNPVSILKGKRNTYITLNTRRQDVLHGGYEGRLDEFFHLLSHSSDPQWRSSGGLNISRNFRDFATVLLFTGIRMSEGLELKWIDVHMDDPDTDRHYFQLHDTKNKRDFSVPISIPVAGALKSRKAERENQWVFPSPVNKGQNLTNPRRQWDKVTDWLGTKVTNHTLRRTFASSAELCGLHHETRARMLNHKTGSMTETYVINSVATLAPRFQDVADMIMKDPVHYEHRLHKQGRGQPEPEPDDDDF
jgi:integrase